MIKTTSVYICQQCGYESPKWLGRCSECGEWNTLVETAVSTKNPKSKISSFAKATKDRQNSKPQNLNEISASQTKRTLTNIAELDRVLGGGIVPGQVILIAGEPGIGKSTLLLQVAEKLNEILKNPSTGSGQALKTEKHKSNNELRIMNYESVLYVSGEESAGQIAIRAKRLGINNKNIQLLETSDIDSIINTIYTFKDTVLQGVIIDSIQTMQTSDLSGMAGSVGQVRECAYRLVRMAKDTGIPVFIVGHVTKQGSVAGPSVLMHIVDTVLWFEGDKNLSLRLLRAVKNRFGPTDEVGVFTMEDKGLLGVTNLEKLFLGDAKNVSGSITTCIMEGTRPILVEVQALVVPTKMAFPKRVAQGFEAKRFELLLAVLTRRCGIPLNDYDCFVNISGGINIKGDPSADLAVCLSIASSFFDKAVPKKCVAIGEVGLLGDIRGVTLQDRRIKETGRLGYAAIISNKDFTYLNETIRRVIKN